MNHSPDEDLHAALEGTFPASDAVTLSVGSAGPDRPVHRQPVVLDRQQVESLAQEVRDRQEALNVEQAVSEARSANSGPGTGWVAGELNSALMKSVQEQPLTTVGLAIVLGFVIGAVWKA